MAIIAAEPLYPKSLTYCLFERMFPASVQIAFAIFAINNIYCYKHIFLIARRQIAMFDRSNVWFARPSELWLPKYNVALLKNIEKLDFENRYKRAFWSKSFFNFMM